MHDPNQAPENGPPPPPSPAAAAAATEPAPAGGSPPLADTSEARGLVIWLGIVLGAFLLGLLGGSAELGLMAAIGALFAVAHAADRDPRWIVLHHFLRWMVPALGAVGFAGLAAWLGTSLPAGRERDLAIAASGLAAVLMVLTAVPAVGNRLVALLFGGRPGSHVLRLAARIALMCFACAYPLSVAFRQMLADGQIDPSLLGSHTFVGSLVGFVLLSLGAVGLFVSRGPRDTLARLGLRGVGPRDAAWTGIGLLALLLLNQAFEALSRTVFPGAAAHDLRVTQLIAGDLSRVEALLLGISAGVGEEVAMRGALQPRLGLLLTAALFGLLHVQYSWIGITTIVLIGALLGWIRNRTSTTVAVVIHVLYDILAVLATQQSGRG